MMDGIDADDVAAHRSQRARLTCVQCHRRKIKCDKNIPCSTCIKRGIAHACNREEDPTTRDPPAPSHTHDEPPASSETIRLLLQRVAQLEAGIQHVQQNIPDQAHEDHHDIPVQSTTPIFSSPRARSIAPEAEISTEAEDDDAAIVLEFLAWGRKKNVDFLSVPEHDSGPRRPNFDHEDGVSATRLLNESANNALLDLLEVLLPDRETVHQLADYHNESILWYHGSYSAKIFSEDLQTFYTEYQGNVRHERLNIQWLALLFSILAGSMTCASKATYSRWGFSDAEISPLSTQWYEAAISSLNIAKYTEVHTIYSVQTIATLTISAHTLGRSNSQSVLLAAAGRIAQSLGLHRPGPEVPPTSIGQLRRREAGKRVFTQLCTQDWFQTPFSETYSLSPRFINTVRPLNCNDGDMVCQPQSIPTEASYCNFRYEFAALMPQLLDAMRDCTTLFTKYEQVLKFDDKMRKLVTAYMPTFLSPNAPLADEWPAYVNWGRRSLTICASHKIIMLHRKFIGRSFVNTAFSFTRRTCLAASKTILKEVFAASDQNGPVLWIEQAFAVAAGIILCLDTLHRTPDDKEYEGHSRLIAETIDYLTIFDHSRIASRGARLISSLQQELDRSGLVGSRKRTRTATADDTEPLQPQKRHKAFNIQTVIRNVSQNLSGSSPAVNLDGEQPTQIEDNVWDAFLHFVPPQTGFDSQYLFEDLLPA